MRVSSILVDFGYPELKRHVLGQTGLAYYSDKDEDLASRIARRFAALGIHDCDSYLAVLRGGSTGRGEMNALIGELTIGETYFFRQRPQFDLLRETIFPDLLERNRPTRRLRIWSAGCATGAEPYSVALLLQLELADRVEGWDVSIFGTDINLDFLDRARAARYDEWAFRELPEAVKTRCFERDGRSWTLRKEFQSRVAFRQHNLIADDDPPGGGLPFDLILCRNVMIYFDSEQVRRTVGRFYDTLAPGGWLLVGHAEPNPEVFRRFRTLSTAQATVYQKNGEAGPEVPATGSSVFARGPAAEPYPGSRAPMAASRNAPGPFVRAATSFAAAPWQLSETIEEARLLADRGRWREAEELCRKLIRSDALNSAAHFTLGAVLEHTASGEQAAREFQKAIYLDRGFVLAHYHLGTSLQSRGQAPRARKAFRTVLELIAGKPPEEPIEHGDGITAAELGELARMHLELTDRK